MSPVLPPEAVNVINCPEQIGVVPLMSVGAVGGVFTVTSGVVLWQSVVVFVKVKVAVPFDNPLTSPALVTLATVGLLLTHVPPVVGDNCVVAYTQIEFEPVIETVGNAFTVTCDVVA